MEVAKYLGISQPAYANYERGLRQADYDTLKRLADYFDVSIDYLLGRETKTPRSRTRVASMAVCGLADVIIRSSHSKPFDNTLLSTVVELYFDIADNPCNTPKSINKKLEQLEKLLSLPPFYLHRVAEPKDFPTPVTIAAESGEKLEGVAAPDEADELSAFEEYENN